MKIGVNSFVKQTHLQKEAFTAERAKNAEILNGFVINGAVSLLLIVSSFSTFLSSKGDILTLLKGDFTTLR